MKIKIETERLRRRRLFLASPQFGGACSSIFAKSLADLAQLCAEQTIPLGRYLLCNESLVTRARNYICHAFMASPAEHLMFVDADIGFDPIDVLGLLMLQVRNPNYEIIGAPYRRKTVGLGHVVNYDTKIDMAAKEPIEVTAIGTGFMMISRDVLRKFSAAFPQFIFKPDLRPGEPESMTQYFQAEIDPISQRYLSEDYWFCNRCNEIGIKTWLCPWMKLRHVGTHVFE